MDNLTLEILALSDYADFSQTGKMTIAGIFDEIYAGLVPINYSQCFVVFTITGASPSSKMNVRLSVQHTESRNEVFSQYMELSIGRNGKGNSISQILNLQLPEYGEYKITVSGASELGSTVFHVLESDGGRGTVSRERPVKRGK